MRVVLQRVRRARVTVDGEVVGAIDRGLVLLVGVGRGDAADDADRLAEKIVGLRVFEDDDGKTNLALGDVGGEVLVVSQFTLYGDVRKGRRPSWTDAEDPAVAQERVEAFAGALERRGVRVARGVFGAHMEVELVNDGPFTMILVVAESADPPRASGSMTRSMYLDVFDRNPYGTNCWLLAAEGADDAVVVDPGFEPDAVHAMLRAAGKAPAAVLLTHAHGDHACRREPSPASFRCTIHPADAARVRDPDAWARGSGDPARRP